jgi:von Willebrand factor type A domain
MSGVKRALIFCAALVAWSLLLSCRPAQSEEPATAGEFRTAKPSIVQQLRDRDKETRVAAAARLADYATSDSIKLLLSQVVASKDEDLRRTGFEVLLKLNGNEEACKQLLTTATREWKQGKPGPEDFAVLEALLASELPAAAEQALEIVKQAASRPRGREALILLTDDLALRTGDERFEALKQLMTLPPFKDDFAVRRTIAQALTRVRSKPAVSRLVELLGESKGEVQSDIVRYLTHITGQEFGNDARKWDAWWKENQEDFTIPPADKSGPGAQWVPRVLTGPTYYKVPLTGSRILFVMDTSSSMSIGNRIGAAKRELVRAIGELPGDVQFNVVVFNRQANAWRSKLMPANEDNKHAASYFVTGQPMASGTASFDALELAINQDAEVIYFVTDGEPFGGRIVVPAEIVLAITQLNQFRRTTIHCFGIGVGPEGNRFDQFLSKLAEQNYGQYRRVDE